MLVVSWPFWGVATTCGVALIGGEAIAHPARQASISNTMRRAVVSPSPLLKTSTRNLTAATPLSIRRNFAEWVTDRSGVPFFRHRSHDYGWPQSSAGVVRLPGWEPGIDAGRRLRESRGERTLLQMRSHLRDHRGRHLARHPARARVDSRQPLQLATQLQSVVNHLFPHGIEPARWRAVRITKNSANGSARRMTEKPEVLHFGL